MSTKLRVRVACYLCGNISIGIFLGAFAPNRIEGLGLAFGVLAVAWIGLKLTESIKK